MNRNGNTTIKEPLLIWTLCRNIRTDVKGDVKQSKRFIKPVRVSRSFCDRFFLDSKGQLFHWHDKKTENQTIGSYTRTIRAILDAEKYPKRTVMFLEYISKVI